MKVLTKKGFEDEVVYIHRGDISFLSSAIDIPIPASIFLKAFSGSINIVDSRNRFEFLFFEDKISVEFIKGLDFIVDYSTLINVTKKELKKIISAQKEEERLLRQSFANARTTYERQHIAQQIELMRYKIADLYTVLQVKKGKLVVKIP